MRRARWIPALIGLGLFVLSVGLWTSCGPAAEHALRLYELAPGALLCVAGLALLAIGFGWGVE